MELWTCYFEITYYNSITKKKDVEKGIIIAHTFSEVANRLENYYGDELISIDTLKWIGDDGDILFLNKEGGIDIE